MYVSHALICLLADYCIKQAHTFLLNAKKIKIKQTDTIQQMCVQFLYFSQTKFNFMANKIFNNFMINKFSMTALDKYEHIIIIRFFFKHGSKTIEQYYVNDDRN